MNSPLDHSHLLCEKVVLRDQGWVIFRKKNNKTKA